MENPQCMVEDRTPCYKKSCCPPALLREHEAEGRSGKYRFHHEHVTRCPHEARAFMALDKVIGVVCVEHRATGPYWAVGPYTVHYYADVPVEPWLAGCLDGSTYQDALADVIARVERELRMAERRIAHHTRLLDQLRREQVEAAS